MRRKITASGWLKHFTKKWIYTDLLGANTVQKSADEGEIKSKDGNINAAFA